MKPQTRVNIAVTVLFIGSLSWAISFFGGMEKNNYPMFRILECIWYASTVIALVFMPWKHVYRKIFGHKQD